MAKKKNGERGPDIAVDADGAILPYSPEQVRAITDRAFAEGRLVATIIEMPSGELAVNVLEEAPREDLADALDAAARAYRRALMNH